MQLSKFERLLLIITALSTVYRFANNRWPVSLEVEE